MRDFLRKVETTIEELLVKPFNTGIDANSYYRSYETVLAKLAHLVAETGIHAEDERLFVAASQLLNMALRSVGIISRVYSIQHVKDLAPRERAKTIQASRFIVEHPLMFSEPFLLRAEKFAQAIALQEARRISGSP